MVIMKTKILKRLRALIRYFLVFKTNKYKTRIKFNTNNPHLQAALKILIVTHIKAKMYLINRKRIRFHK